MMPASIFVAKCAARGITLSLDGAGNVQVNPNDAYRDGIAYYVSTYSDAIREVISGHAKPIVPKNAPARIAPVQSRGGIPAQPAVRRMPEIVLPPAPAAQPAIAAIVEQTDQLDIVDAELVAMGNDLDTDWDRQEALYDESLSASAYYAYLAARDNLLPMETIPIAPGTVISDPNLFLTMAVHRARREREKWGKEYKTSPYTNFEADNAAIETIAQWYRALVTRHQIQAWYGVHLNNPRNSGTSPWKGNCIHGNYAYLYRSNRRARTRTRHTADRRSLCATVIR